MQTSKKFVSLLVQIREQHERLYLLIKKDLGGKKRTTFKLSGILKNLRVTDVALGI